VTQRTYREDNYPVHGHLYAESDFGKFGNRKTRSNANTVKMWDAQRVSLAATRDAERHHRIKVLLFDLHLFYRTPYVFFVRFLPYLIFSLVISTFFFVSLSFLFLYLSCIFFFLHYLSVIAYVFTSLCNFFLKFAPLESYTKVIITTLCLKYCYYRRGMEW
jgi:hypothetical protein